MAIRDRQWDSLSKEWAWSLSGAACGLIGGCLFLICLMAASVQMEAEAWFPPKLIASSVLGVMALVGGLPSILLGFGIHLSVSALFGTVYGLITPQPARAGQTAILGLIFGITLWALMTYILMPLVAPIFLSRVGLFPWGSWFVSHLAYGLSFGLLPALYEQIGATRVTETVYRKAA